MLTFTWHVFCSRPLNLCWPELTWISPHSKFFSVPFTSFSPFLYSSHNNFGTFSILQKEITHVGTKNKTSVQRSKSKLLLGFPAVETMMLNWCFSLKRYIFAIEKLLWAFQRFNLARGLEMPFLMQMPAHCYGTSNCEYRKSFFQQPPYPLFFHVKLAGIQSCRWFNFVSFCFMLLNSIKANPIELIKFFRQQYRFSAVESCWEYG